MTQLYDNLYKTIGLILAENGETRSLSLLRIVNKVVSKAVSNIDEPLVFEYDSMRASQNDESLNISIKVKCRAFISFGDGNSTVFNETTKYRYKEKSIFRVKIYKVDGGKTDHIQFSYITLDYMTNFITLGDIGIIDLYHMFSESDFNANISPNFNTSNIISMESMFYESYEFNQPIGHWDTSNVMDMDHMFCNASSFNQPIGRWDVSQVTNMEAMFYGAIKFNQPIGNWITSNVSNMGNMFNGAKSFNQPIDNWDVSNVTDMSGMFNGAEQFNQPIGNWDVGKVTDMSHMFQWAINFNQPLKWKCDQINRYEVYVFKYKKT